MLARQVSTARALIGNRLELGVGTGYAKEEFDRAGLPWPSPGERIDHLERTLAELDTDGLPVLVGGWGDRMLTLAARRASIVGFTGTASHRDGRLTTLAGLAKFGERVEFVRAALGEREAEFNVLVQRVVLTEDRRSVLEQAAPYAPELSPDELGEIPTLLVGTLGADRAAAQRAPGEAGTFVRDGAGTEHGRLRVGDRVPELGLAEEAGDRGQPTLR